MTALAVGIGWAGAEAADSPQVAAGGILPRPVSIDMKDGRQACFDIAKGISVSYSGVPASERDRISGIYGQPLWCGRQPCREEPRQN